MVHWDIIGDGFCSYLQESQASEEAKKRGLKGIGYGRYVDPSKPKVVVAKTVNGRLVLTPQGAKHPTSKKSAKKAPVPQPKTKPQVAPTKAPKTAPTKVPTQRKTSGAKNKALKRVNTSNTPAFTTRLGIDDKTFAKNNAGNWLTPKYKKFKGNYRTGKFPPRYVDVLERLLNSQLNKKTAKWSHFSDIAGGQGKIPAQAGELMTLMSTTMDDTTADQFFTELMDTAIAHKKENPKGKPVVDVSWIKAARNNRKAILNRLRGKYGDKFVIENGAWDTKEEVEALGLQDYAKNKGFSTDVYFKIKTPKGGVLDEVSLKKDTAVNFLNSGAGKFIEWDPNLPPAIDPRVYGKKENGALRTFSTSKMKKIQLYLKKNPDSDLARTMEAKGIADVASLVGLKKPNRAARKVMLKAAIALAKGGDPEAKKLVAGLNAAQRRYSAAAVDAISKNPKLRQGMLNEIRNEFPLKAVAEGEESMAIGPYSMDPKVMESIFGTRDFNVIKDRLVSQKGPPPFIAYQSGPKTFIPIATITVREDGVGYGGQIKFDMVLDSRFAKTLKEANAKVYGA